MMEEASSSGWLEAEDLLAFLEARDRKRPGERLIAEILACLIGIC